MKKKVFALTMIIGFIWGTVAFAWQDPCLAINNDYTYEECTLTGWIESPVYFSPAPRCAGTVLLLTPGNWTLLDYISYKDTILIANIPCRISNDGDLVCKIITQPEESFNLLFNQE